MSPPTTAGRTFFSLPAWCGVAGQFFGLRNRNANSVAGNATTAEDNYNLVPEPTTTTLALIPAIGMLLRRRRQR